MDRVIEQKKWNRKRILTIVGIVALVALIGASFYYARGGSKLNVDKERITISEVTKGQFKNYIPVNGVVMPISTIYLDVTEGGRVEERYVEDGAMMKKGQPILRLSNTDLMMSLVEQQNSVYNTLMQEQIAQNSARQTSVSNMNQMADVEQQLQEAKRLYDLNKKLYEQKALDYQTYQQSKISYDYLVKKKELQENLLSQDSVNKAQQLVQQNKLYAGANDALSLMQKKVGDLIVRAPVDGQLTSLDAEVGQNKPAGTRLGQIDVISDYKVQVDVDEHYINNVFPGLTGNAVVGNDTLNLIVKKVYPSVADGKFKVDMAFKNKAPNVIHRGQSLQILLTLSDDRPALLLPRGGFYQQTGGNWIFKLSKDGTTAYKAEIQLGGQNPDYYEVVKGLEPGDQVITSSYENFGDNQELIIK
ncbi:efflux transporter periplasmic adaptor subunit [Arachidicoccus ginsenosidimutans]|uniref:efflux RND transporter periplasmic adaptor subunit n=1 Tax=Arachidicoccus sp. BS20 TaxID=1850526 RepID=UPI0007F11307|nr:HlyD family efflux transporter periplasmic adaptor subunit [Arachidicoccus sp. BS20]ANI89887.1 efflux transporter periplasmic adaptor subunit [Arachidicoccus sp. BS20]